MLQAVLSVVTPIFLIAGIGYLWHRRGQPFDTDTVGSVVMYIGSPCLIYSSLTTNAPELSALLTMASSAVLVIGLSAVAGTLFLRVMGWPIPTFLPAIVQANGGNMGLPVVLLAFGETGLALGMAYFFVLSVSQYTLGLSISSGSFNAAELLRQPVIWAVVVVLLVLTTGVRMPDWFNNTADILGGLTIPAMLLMLGTSLARLELSDVSQALTVTVVRLGLGLALGWTAIHLFNLSGVMAGVVLLQATMPSAVFNFVFAERYERDPQKVAAVIVLSTLLSLATLPIFVAWALTL